MAFNWGRESREPEFVLASADADRLGEAAVDLVDAAEGESWYTIPGNAVDEALAVLCLLRRAKAGRRGEGSESGDAAVRLALEQARPEAVVWLASRVVSYMDEHGFPEDVESWLAARPDPPNAD